MRRNECSFNLQADCHSMLSVFLCVKNGIIIPEITCGQQLLLGLHVVIAFTSVTHLFESYISRTDNEGCGSVAEQRRMVSHITRHLRDGYYPKLYNNQRNGHVFNLFIFLLLPCMFRAGVHVSGVWCQRLGAYTIPRRLEPLPKLYTFL
jgi:hypothetical protein